MRVIYGKKDRPDKSHILIIRGFSDESLLYFSEHVEKYPTWGLILCMDVDQEPGTRYWSITKRVEIKETPIHQIVSMFSGVQDSEVIKEVIRRFPAYNEDDDPIVEESAPCTKSTTDILGAIASLEEVSATMMKKRWGGSSTRIPNPEEYRRMFGVFPGEKLIPDTSLPVKVMQFSYSMSKTELVERFRDFYYTDRKDILKHIPPEVIRRMKYAFIERIIDCENFWDISVMDDYRGGPEITNFVIRMGIAPMGDMAEKRSEVTSVSPYRDSSPIAPYYYGTSPVHMRPFMDVPSESLEKLRDAISAPISKESHMRDSLGILDKMKDLGGLYDEILSIKKEKSDK